MKPNALGCPAYAGMDPTSRDAPMILSRLPRLRGDGPLNNPQAGARPAGCPAYAGMDPPLNVPVCRLSGLPRLRGDGPRIKQSRDIGLVVAPPTRGWTGLIRSPAC